jgi:hypothetical protein
VDDIAEAVPPSGRRDDVATLLALGVLAYTLETLIHEGVGHGGVCLAQGHRVTVLTPLWMRCDAIGAPMVAAGPLANMVAAMLSWMALRTGLAAAARLPVFLWLCFVFNGLVAAGYLAVGGATAFGDWAYLFGAVQPAWLWRIGALAAAALGYWILLGAAVRRYAAIAGGDHGAFTRRALVPALGAATVAIAAQIFGQGFALAGLILPVACTLVVGASLWGVRDQLPTIAAPREFSVAFSLPCILLALATAVAYILILGPGFTGLT